MRKFTCTAPEFSYCYSLCDAASFLGDDIDALAELEVGQTYVDGDGDTWERVE